MVIRMRPKFYQAGVLVSRVTRVPLHSLSLQKHTEERHMKMQREGDCPQTRKRGFTRNWISCHLSLRLLTSRTVKKKKNLLSKHNMVCYYGTKLTNTNRESYMEFRPHFSFLEPSFLLSKCSLSHFKFIFLKTGHSACEYLNGIRHLVG